MKLTHLARPTAVAVAAMALVATAGVSTASADSGNTLYDIFPDRLAHAKFTSNGDKFEVWDDEGDGRGAYVTARLGGKIYTCNNTKGAGTKKTCRFNFPENRTITWQLAVEDRGDYDKPTIVSKQAKDQT